MEIYPGRKKYKSETPIGGKDRIRGGIATARPKLLFYISIALVATMAVVSYFKKDGFRALFQIDDQIKKEEQTLKRLKEENRLLRNRVKTAREDPYHVEKFAREKLNLAKEGDVVFRFYKEDRDK
jgi:cell division protein FtsB